MPYLVDTGVLLRIFEDTNPEYHTVRAMLKEIRRVGDELLTTSQNFTEHRGTLERLYTTLNRERWLRTES